MALPLPSLLLVFLPTLAAAQAGPCGWLYQPKVEAALAAKVGHAVLYPMDKPSFEVTFNCLSSSYTQTKTSLAGLTWDVTHALLRMLLADPEQFMKLYSAASVSQTRRWRESFLSAALWPGNECPKPDPMQLAAVALRSAKLPANLTAQRQEVLAALSATPCRVAR